VCAHLALVPREALGHRHAASINGNRHGDLKAAKRYREAIIRAPRPSNEADKLMRARLAALEVRRDGAVALLTALLHFDATWVDCLRHDPDLSSLRGYPPSKALLPCRPTRRIDLLSCHLKIANGLIEPSR
jgi:hypothetical protein